MDKWLDGIQISESDKLKGNRAAAANEKKNIRRREKNYPNNNVNSEQIVNLCAVEGREHNRTTNSAVCRSQSRSKARKGREVKVAQNKSSQNQ